MSTPSAQNNGASPGAATQREDAVAAIAPIIAERPEILLGAAFAGGLVLAMLVRRLGH
jgi:hypothetical protein